MKTLLQKHMEEVIKSSEPKKQKKSVKLPVQINMQDFAKKLLFSLLFPIFLSGCCYQKLVAQLPDQIYFVNDSCEYYLPDYTQVITPIDNCDIQYFYQSPTSGTVLHEGIVTTVSIVAGDVTGNERTITFKVILVDTITPTFEIDTILLNGLSHYQNELRTWHFYNFIN